MTDLAESRRLHVIHCSGCGECRAWRDRPTLTDLLIQRVDPVIESVLRDYRPALEKLRDA